MSVYTSPSWFALRTRPGMPSRPAAFARANMLKCLIQVGHGERELTVLMSGGRWNCVLERGVVVVDVVGFVILDCLESLQQTALGWVFELLHSSTLSLVLDCLYSSMLSVTSPLLNAVVCDFSFFALMLTFIHVFLFGYVETTSAIYFLMNSVAKSVYMSVLFSEANQNISQVT
jgi:hypothetical protein